MTDCAASSFHLEGRALRQSEEGPTWFLQKTVNQENDLLRESLSKGLGKRVRGD